MPSNMAEVFRWVSIDRGIDHDKVLKQATDGLHSISFEEDNHPLGAKHISVSTLASKSYSKVQNNIGKAKNVQTKEPTKKTSTFIDPLSAMSSKSEEDIDGISDDIPDQSEINYLQSSHKRSPADELWKEIEDEVFNSSQDYDGKVKIPSTFQEILTKLESAESSSLSTVQARLDFLESLESGVQKRTSKFLGLSDTAGCLDRSSFQSFVELLNNQLAKYWKDDQRVAVVKLVIQIVKLLSEPDDEIIDFYPTMFFLLSDLVTYFGDLVHDRLVTKCPDLKVNFTFSDVGPQARDLCKNWLYKIASIRELVPRFYMETSLLKCYKFSCEPEGFPSLVERLGLMTRGIANPVVAVYARTYLVQIVQQVMSSNHDLVRSCARQNYEELQNIFKYDYRLSNSQMGKHISNFDLFTPALKWIIRAQIKGLELVDPKRDKIIKQRFNELDLPDPDFFIIHLLECASPQFVAGDMTNLSRVISSSAKNKITNNESDAEQCKNGSLLLASFGKALITASEFNAISSSNKQNLLSVLNQTWKAIMLISDIEYYLRCASVFVSFATLHFGFKELDVLLGDVLTHLNSENNNLKTTSEDQKILEKDIKLDQGNSVCKNKNSTTSLIQIIKTAIFGQNKEIWTPIQALSNCNNLMPLYEHLNGDKRVALAKETLESLCSQKKNREGSNKSELDDVLKDKFYEPISVNALIYLCSILSDSVDALTIEDERRQISSSICYVIRNIDFGDDFEGELKIYTECRGLFKSLDTVQICLSQVALNLAIKVVKKSEKKQAHQKPKIHGFLQACCAFTFITIPSIRCLRTQMKLYILTGQVGFLCRCHGQATASIQAAIDIVTQIFCSVSLKMNEKILSILNEEIPNILSYLLVVPGYTSAMNSDLFEGNLQLIQSLLDAISLVSENNIYIVEAANVYLKLLQLLSVTTWKSYPFQIGGIDANDTLMYANDTNNIFVDKVNSLISVVTNQLQSIVFTSLSKSTQKQKLIALKLFMCILKNCNLDQSSRSLTSLAYNAWLINQEGVYKKEIVQTLSKTRVENSTGNLYKLVHKINEMK